LSVFLHSYTKALRRYDRDLFVERTKDGALCVFRKVKRYKPVCVSEGFRLMNLTECKEFVFALTDNWTLSGRPVEWGIDRVISRLQQHDAWENERFFEELDRENEKVDESRRRALKNEAEAFWSDNRRAFQRATDDILTHSLSKDEPKKRLKDRSIKNGNY
jgi:hypothetical protein